MSKGKIIVSIVLGVGLVFGAGMVAGAAGTEPGSNGDPLITKSYLDEQIAQIDKESAFKPITVGSGKKLSCDAGTQIVIVSGAGKATGALSDTTKGEKLQKGKKAECNHMCLTISNNTGIKMSKSAKVLVNGSYEIK